MPAGSHSPTLLALSVSKGGGAVLAFLLAYCSSNEAMQAKNAPSLCGARTAHFAVSM